MSAPVDSPPVVYLDDWRDDLDADPATVVSNLRAALSSSAPAPGARPLRPSPRADGSSSDWLTAPLAANHLGMSLKALYTAVARQQVPVSRLKRRLRFSRSGLNRLLLRAGGRGDPLAPRVSSPGKESERC
jgi:hypothetical protein